MSENNGEVLTLEKRIQDELTGLHARMCIYADDLRGTAVSIGSDEVFESASTIKIFVLGTLYALAEKGKASLDSLLTYREDQFVDGTGVIRSLDPGFTIRAKDAATLMIICSDNIAANMLIEYLGLEAINAFIRQIGCLSSILHRRLYSEGGHGPLGDITARDMGRFFMLLAKGELVSPSASLQMRHVFRRQQYKEMLTGQLPPCFWQDAGLSEDPPAFYAASKSGSMDACRNDGGIIHTPFGEYVLILLCKDFKNKLEVPDHPAFLYGQRVSRLLFDQYVAKKGTF